MSKQSTLIQSEEARELVSAIGGLIREFLSFVSGAGAGTIFSQVDNNKDALHNMEPAIKEAAVRFRERPDLFQDDKLVGYGAEYTTAVAHPVRIEVRQVAGEPGVAQIAARGITGEFRRIVLEFFREHAHIPADRFYVRLSGRASFEINIAGVNKALPLHYASERWEAVLEAIAYKPGPGVDARRTRTLIAADADGTTWDSPRDGKAPELNTSAALPALTEYLRHGGIYLIISGNHLDRTVARVGRHLEVDCRRNLLISANGGANLVYFNEAGDPVESEEYRSEALAVADAKSSFALDAVYLGDDGRPSGNDREAFEAIGPEHSILVANPASTDIIPFLTTRTIGGLVDGTRRVLEYVNGVIREHPHQEIFTQANLAALVRAASQA